MEKKGIGRPKSEATLEREKQESWLAEVPAYLHMTANEKAEMAAQLAELDRIRLELLKKFKHGQWTPDDHALNMASLGHELMEGYEEKILEDDARYRLQAKRLRQKAGASNKQKAEPRMTAVLKKNEVLLEKLGVAPFSTHSIAVKICNEWESMSLANRLLGEPSTMIYRGDGSPCPSVRTIERWINKSRCKF